MKVVFAVLLVVVIISLWYAGLKAIDLVIDIIKKQSRKK